jgi:hypothetical protein
MNADMTIPIKKIYQLRLKPFVEQRIAKFKHNTFLRKHTQEEWLAYIQAEMLEYLSLEKFMNMSDEKLRSMVGRRMSLKLVAGMLNDLTPEQMAIFDECLVRR